MTARTNAAKPPARPQHVAIVGAGLAGVACARTLVQAGHQVTVFEKSRRAGGRMSTRESHFGSFDHGAQYFTVRDKRFDQALQTVPGLCRPWSANTIRVIDDHGGLVALSLPPAEPHWVAAPGMNSLPQRWAAPLVQAGQLLVNLRVTQVERDALAPERWQLRTEGAQGEAQVHGGFDAVLLAVPSPQALALLRSSNLGKPWWNALLGADMEPCWTLMLAFPQASQPGLTTLGPQWNAARSNHHRIAWLARESSKPGRGSVERWTVQASATWSQEHLEDSPERVQAKLLRAFSEVTGIRAEPALASVHRWRFARTRQALGQSHLWDAQARLGLCGDWCLGHRVENAFLSGLSLALAVAKA
jgi:renalase